MKKIMMIFASFSFLLVTVSAFADKYQEAVPGQKAPLLVVSKDSKELPLEELKGRWIVLSFWSACDAESRMYQHLLAQLANNDARRSCEDSRPVEVLSVNLDRSGALMEEIVKQDGLLCKRQYHVDGQQQRAAICRSFLLNDAMRTFIINPDGEIVCSDPTEEELRQLFC